MAPKRSRGEMKEVGNVEKIETILDVPPVESPGKSFLDETCITCDICLEILYSPINCGPCNHKFCAACMYRWLDAHHTCPKCRNMVKEITKDVFANQICEQYLKTYPNRARSKEALQEQDKAELEYLEKLIKRARSNRRIPSVIDEDDERQMAEFDQERNLWQQDVILPENTQPRSDYRKFREAEWMLRARRLREDMNMPVREWSPEVENNERDHHYSGYRHMIRILGAGDLDDSSDDDDRFVPPHARIHIMRGVFLPPIRPQTAIRTERTRNPPRATRGRANRQTTRGINSRPSVPRRPARERVRRTLRMNDSFRRPPTPAPEQSLSRRRSGDRILSSPRVQGPIRYNLRSRGQ